MKLRNLFRSSALLGLVGLTVATAASAVFAADANAPAATADKPKQALTETSFVDVRLNDNFWAPRIEANRVVSVPHNIKWCETETSRIDNFKVAAGLQKGEFKGIYFDDSDVYKILEGFAYSLAAHPDENLRAKASEWIDYIGAAQQDDGYLMNYFVIGHPNEKWTNLGSMHELYCAGHMAEAAVAYQRATGDDKFVKINRRLLDLICKRYGPNPGQLINVAGHEEIELALVKMYQLTGDKKYLDEAKFFIDARGVAEGRETGGVFGEYCQDHKPVREQDEIVGHAVRAMYLYCGATDVAGYFDDPALMTAMRRIFNNVTLNKMYITGGIGSSAKNEGFEGNFVLPNREAYCETCAAIGLVLWSHRMNLATGEAKFVDVMERAAYNGFVSGYALNGDKYFYVNPLESVGNHHRQPFFGCACCPSNVIRVLPSIPGYVYATAESEAGAGDDTIVVNMFVQGTATVKLADKTVKLEQTTNYPYDGKFSLKATVDAKDAASVKPLIVKIRVPAWANAVAEKDGYRTSRFELKDGETATIEDEFDTPVVRMLANPNVEADSKRVALQRGPIVYCFEAVDNPGVDVSKIVLAKDPEFNVEVRENFISDETDNEATKNSAARTVAVVTCKDVAGRTLTAVPYCVWDNRAAGKMDVWVRQAGLGDDAANAGPWTDEDGEPVLYRALDASKLTDETPDLSQFADFSGSFFEDQYSTFDGTTKSEPANSADGSVPRATWWAHKGTDEWFEYAYYQPRKVSSATLYWFDDEARNGGCRVPASWKLTYQAPNSDEWKEVETTDAYAVDRDKDIVVNFAEVEVAKIRVEVRLQDGFSGGVLKFDVK